MTTPLPSTEAKAQEKVQVNIGLSEGGELVFSVPLNLIDRTTARGIIEDLRDVIDGWYAKRQQQRMALAGRSLPVQAREALAKVGKLFIPR